MVTGRWWVCRRVFDAGDVGVDAVVLELGGERVGGLAGPDEHGEGFVVDVDDDGVPGSVVVTVSPG